MNTNLNETQAISNMKLTYSKNIEYLKSLERTNITFTNSDKQLVNGIILSNSKGSILAEPETGLVRSFKKVNNKLILSNKHFGSNIKKNTSSPYIWVSTPWGFTPTAHSIIAVATSKFDNKNPLIFEIGHLNSNCRDNRADNLEVITHGVNMDEVSFRKLVDKYKIDLHKQILTHDKIQWLLNESGGDEIVLQGLITAAWMCGWSNYNYDRQINKYEEDTEIEEWGYEDEYDSSKSKASLFTEIDGIRYPISRISYM